jgi:hypothetical protein
VRQTFDVRNGNQIIDGMRTMLKDDCFRKPLTEVSTEDKCIEFTQEQIVEYPRRLCDIFQLIYRQMRLWNQDFREVQEGYFINETLKLNSIPFGFRMIAFNNLNWTKLSIELAHRSIAAEEICVGSRTKGGCNRM